MKRFALFATLALASVSLAQSRVAATVDLKDGQLTPVIATTIKRFEPFKLFGTELTPEAWALAAYDVPSKQFGLGAAAVVGKEFSPGWSWFAGVSGAYSTDTKRITPGVVVGIDFKF